MTTYNIYSAYKSALKTGRKNIRFVSLKKQVFAGNPVTSDTGLGSVDSQSGDFWLTAITTLTGGLFHCVLLTT